MMDLDLFGVIEGPYRDRIGREYESVQVPWHTVAAILGRGLYGQVCDDLKIVAVLIERGYPRWLEECEEGWVDDYGVGYIGPSLDEWCCPRCGQPTAGSVAEDGAFEEACEDCQGA